MRHKEKNHEPFPLILSMAALSLFLGFVFGVSNPYPNYAIAAQIQVPNAYSTIQAAIDNAEEGDEVVVAPGTYYENISFLGKGIAVKSTDPNDSTIRSSTIIDGMGTGRVVTFRNGEGNSSVLSGFTLKNGYASQYGGGIYCWQTSPTISNCTIADSSSGWSGGLSGWGGGICFFKSSSIINNCTISNNSAINNGGGIICHEASPSINSCTISGNSTEDGDGGGIYCYFNSSPAINNCIISNNAANDDGGGISCWSNSSPAINNCIINGNTASYGGGISGNDQNSSPTISNCIISNNMASYDGGGIYRFSSSLTISNCTISSNSASCNGGGICCYSSSLTTSNCTISNNTASYDGGGIYCYFSPSPTINSCILRNDEPDEIFTVGAFPVITYSDIQGGSLGEGNIDADPLFIDPNKDDYHLQPGSPCIDSGDPGSIINNDLDNTIRPKDGNEDGIARSDMGAYEYEVNHPPVINKIDTQKVREGNLLQFTITAADPDGDNLVYASNNLPSGAVFDPITQKFSWKPKSHQAGTYEVTFSATDTGLPPESDTQTVVIIVSKSSAQQLFSPQYFNIFNTQQNTWNYGYLQEAALIFSQNRHQQEYWYDQIRMWYQLINIQYHTLLSHRQLPLQLPFWWQSPIGLGIY